jgi:hypothetical protein
MGELRYNSPVRKIKKIPQTREKPPEESPQLFIQVDSRDHRNLDFLPCAELSVDLCHGVWVGLALESVVYVVHIALG